MNIVADECVDKVIVTILRQLKINVTYIAEIDPSISDEVVLKIAFDEKIVLLTSDKDFGKLIFKNKADNNGVILLRSTGLSYGEKTVLAKEILSVLKKDIRNCFVVITQDTVRIRHIF
jgi:predicted nuclease of predicted toxin-antitoxin system